MTPDEQEWRSRVHDTVGVKVIKLKSGKWALFDMWSQFIGLVEPDTDSQSSTEALGFAVDALLSGHGLKVFDVPYDFNAGRAKLLHKEVASVEKKPTSLAALDL